MMDYAKPISCDMEAGEGNHVKNRKTVSYLAVDRLRSIGLCVIGVN